MARKFHVDPPIKLQINVPRSVLDKVEILLFDPVTGQRKYGALSEFVTRLLREELQRLKDNAA